MPKRVIQLLFSILASLAIPIIPIVLAPSTVSAANLTPFCSSHAGTPSFPTGTPSPLPPFVPNALFVKQVATGNGTGADWDNALGADKLKNVEHIEGTVYIAAGRYAPDHTIEFEHHVRNSVAIYGGFPADATGTDLSGYHPNVNQTIISGEVSDHIFKHHDHDLHDITLQGLVLVNADDHTGAVFESIKLDYTPVSFQYIDLAVMNNSSSNDGGGFHITNKKEPDSRILFLNSVFTNNFAADDGAAISIPNVYPGHLYEKKEDPPWNPRQICYHKRIFKGGT